MSNTVSADSIVKNTMMASITTALLGGGITHRAYVEEQKRIQAAIWKESAEFGADISDGFRLWHVPTHRLTEFMERCNEKGVWASREPFNGRQTVMTQEALEAYKNAPVSGEVMRLLGCAEANKLMNLPDEELNQALLNRFSEEGKKAADVTDPVKKASAVSRLCVNAKAEYANTIAAMPFDKMTETLVHEFGEDEAARILDMRIKDSDIPQEWMHFAEDNGQLLYADAAIVTFAARNTDKIKEVLTEMSKENFLVRDDLGNRNKDILYDGAPWHGEYAMTLSDAESAWGGHTTQVITANGLSKAEAALLQQGLELREVKSFAFKDGDNWVVQVNNRDKKKFEAAFTGMEIIRKDKGEEFALISDIFSEDKARDMNLSLMFDKMQTYGTNRQFAEELASCALRGETKVIIDPSDPAHKLLTKGDGKVIERTKDIQTRAWDLNDPRNNKEKIVESITESLNGRTAGTIIWDTANPKHQIRIRRNGIAEELLNGTSLRAWDIKDDSERAELMQTVETSFVLAKTKDIEVYENMEYKERTQPWKDISTASRTLGKLEKENKKLKEHEREWLVGLKLQMDIGSHAIWNVSYYNEGQSVENFRADEFTERSTDQETRALVDHMTATANEYNAVQQAENAGITSGKWSVLSPMIVMAETRDIITVADRTIDIEQETELEDARIDAGQPTLSREFDRDGNGIDDRFQDDLGDGIANIHEKYQKNDRDEPDIGDMPV